MSKRMERDWLIGIPKFPMEHRKIIKTIAKKNRMGIGAYIGRFLDEQIEKYHKQEASHADD